MSPNTRLLLDLYYKELLFFFKIFKISQKFQKKKHKNPDGKLYYLWQLSSHVAFEQSTWYITSIGWVVSLNLRVVLITLILSPPIGYASSPYGASIDASCVTQMSQFAYRVHVSYLQSPFSLCSCSKEVES